MPARFTSEKLKDFIAASGESTVPEASGLNYLDDKIGSVYKDSALQVCISDWSCEPSDACWRNLEDARAAGHIQNEAWRQKASGAFFWSWIKSSTTQEDARGTKSGFQKMVSDGCLQQPSTRSDDDLMELRKRAECEREPLKKQRIASYNARTNVEDARDARYGWHFEVCARISPFQMHESPLDIVEVN